MSKYQCGGSYDCKALSMRGLSLAGKDFYIKFRVRTKEEGLSSWKSTVKELSGLYQQQLLASILCFCREDFRFQVWLKKYLAQPFFDF